MHVELSFHIAMTLPAAIGPLEVDRTACEELVRVMPFLCCFPNFTTKPYVSVKTVGCLETLARKSKNVLFPKISKAVGSN